MYNTAIHFFAEMDRFNLAIPVQAYLTAEHLQEKASSGKRHNGYLLILA